MLSGVCAYTFRTLESFEFSFTFVTKSSIAEKFQKTPQASIKNNKWQTEKPTDSHLKTTFIQS